MEPKKNKKKAKKEKKGINEEPKIDEINENKIQIIEKKEELKKEEEISDDGKNEIEIINKKCSLEEHKDIDAIYYCQECKISMCNKCDKIHSNLLKHHHKYSLDKDINEIFTGLCLMPNHSLKLEYYCKTHNQLCCAACIAKIKYKGNGQHKDCEIYKIIEIKNIKKENLDKNMKKLDELSQKLEPNIKEIKDIYEKLNERKEKLKEEIQKIFTKIRTELNNREDKLFKEVDLKFNQFFFKEELIKESEKLPKLLNTSIEGVKMNENDWNDENILPKLINDGINIENIIKNIDEIYVKINNFTSKKNMSVEFSLNQDEIEKGLIDNIKSFGRIKIIDKETNLEQIILNNIIENFDDENL